MKNLQQDVCCSNIIHHEAVNKAKENLPNDELIFNLADFFKTFGDSTRIKIICALMETELCVCDLANVISTSQSAVSHQLRTAKWKPTPQGFLSGLSGNGKLVSRSIK